MEITLGALQSTGEVAEKIVVMALPVRSLQRRGEKTESGKCWQGIRVKNIVDGKEIER